MSHFYDEITTALPELQVLKDEPMSRHTTFRIGGPADYFVCPDREQIAEVLAVAKKCGMAITVIGNGSNLLVGDKGIRGLVVEIGSAMNQITVDKEHITAGAGALLSQVAAKAAAAELGGMEFAAGIPGSVGGAVTMNAGAYGGEMKDILRTVTVLTPEGELKTLDVSEMDLSYRHSCVPEQQYIVLEAEIELGDNWASTKEIKDWIELRESNDSEWVNASVELKQAVGICEKLIKEGRVQSA